MVNASSLTFSDITVNSIFSLNNTIFSHYTLEQIKNSVVDNMSVTIDNVSLSNVSITNIDSAISSINTELNNLSTVNTSVNNLITEVTGHNTSLTDLNASITSLSTSITTVQTKTSLIDLSGSTEFTLGENMSINIGTGLSGIIKVGSSTATGNLILDSPSTSGVMFNTPLYINHTILYTSPNQIGWSQGFTTPINKGSFSSSGINVLGTYNTGGITSGQQLPIGVYMISLSGLGEVGSGITGGTVNNFSAGYSIGTTYDTSGLTRTQLQILQNQNYGVISKTVGEYPISFCHVVRNTTDNNYIAGYILIDISSDLVDGTMNLFINSYCLTRIG